MEFHHVVYPKVSSVSRMISNGTPVDKIQKEVDKCVVLCSNCHRIRHYNIRKGIPDASTDTRLLWARAEELTAPS